MVVIDNAPLHDSTYHMTRRTIISLQVGKVKEKQIRAWVKTNNNSEEVWPASSYKLMG
jgi:hypothetical protein